MKKAAILIFFGLILVFPVLALAKIGVGVGIGRIEIDQPLKAGLIYTLPSLVIINTGDEPSDYGVQIAFHESQKQLRPAKEWFKFEPAEFYLEPGQSQLVQVKLTLPIRGAQPGDYFAFLQGRPLRKTESGMASVGVAAATKLYFTVTPANFFMGLYHRIVSVMSLYSPWSYVVLAVIVAALLIATFRRFFSFNIGVSRKK
ncbi:MAG: hypothetical protein PHQ42_01895 [Patescibacteria group bacterium]|nr:hypothetical protein [Patescibacteria group bacterium]